MRKLLFLSLIVLLAAAVASDAWARAGRGSSFGSRGDRTFDRPMERSITPPPSVAPSQPAPMLTRPSVAPPVPQAGPMAAQGGFFQRNPILGGLMGGLIGAGIGSMLFGHSPALAAASDAAPMAGLIGTLLQVALIGGGVWLLLRLFRRRQPAAGAGAGLDYPLQGGSGAAPRQAVAFQPTDADKQAFGDILTGVQKAWSDNDVAALRRLGTPEVVSWLVEDLSDNASKGIVNRIEQVELLQGDVTESWNEGAREYVTARLVYRCVDADYDAASGKLLNGDPSIPQEVAELWTYSRVQGGQWLLSAIEQERG